jgi:hypothetical protein
MVVSKIDRISASHIKPKPSRAEVGSFRTPSMHDSSATPFSRPLKELGNQLGGISPRCWGKLIPCISALES